MDFKKQVLDAAQIIKNKSKLQPKIALILGSGLGPLADEVIDAVKIPYSEIPHFKVPKISGHQGQLVIGKLNGVEVMVQQGRWHFYEGYSMNEVVFPVRVYQELGIETVIITNAAGGVNLKFQAGDLMLLTDHLNLMGDNPLKGVSGTLFGSRFPDMTEVYDLKLRELALKVSQSSNIPLQQGVYVALSGPSYETPSEIRMMRVLGADAVGMSTVPEAIAARHCGLKVMGISCITNMGAGISNQPLSHDEVKETADKSMLKFINLIKGVVSRI